MNRIKTYDATGIAPNGMLYAGDLNLLQDTVAALSDFAQTFDAGTMRVGDNSLILSKFGAGELSLAAALRISGYLRANSGVMPANVTTTQRNALVSPPTGLVIFNTTTGQIETNLGTPAAPTWSSVGSQLTSGTGTLAARPAANAVLAGSTFFATDQIVKYISTGAAWLRESTPAGVTAEWFSSSAAPTGWVPYDGGNLPAATGIYADLYAHLGNSLVTPDTRGRVSVGQGSHADVAAILANDALAVANRSPKHNSSISGAPAIGSLGVGGAPGVGSLSLPQHGHGLTIPPHTIYIQDAGDVGAGGQMTWVLRPTTPGGSGENQHGYEQWGHGGSTVDGVTSTPAINGAPSVGSLGVTGAPAVGSLASGPGGSRPTDQPAYVVCLKIAKL